MGIARDNHQQKDDRSRVRKVLSRTVQGDAANAGNRKARIRTVDIAAGGDIAGLGAKIRKDGHIAAAEIGNKQFHQRTGIVDSDLSRTI